MFSLENGLGGADTQRIWEDQQISDGEYLSEDGCE